MVVAGTIAAIAVVTGDTDTIVSSHIDMVLGSWGPLDPGTRNIERKVLLAPMGSRFVPRLTVSLSLWMNDRC